MGMVTNVWSRAGLYTTVSWQDTQSQSDNAIQTEVDKITHADIENSKNILFSTGMVTSPIALEVVGRQMLAEHE
jgi:diphthamide biosynthesis methyltransferase